MIETSATVVASGPGIAWVETARASACGGCGGSKTCGAAVFGQLVKTGASRVAVVDPLGLAAGERVVIGVPDGLLVRASLVAYLLPLAALVAGAGLGEALGAPETLVALAGLAGLGVGLWLTRHLSGGAGARARWQPVLLGREGGPRLALALPPGGPLRIPYPSAPPAARPRCLTPNDIQP